MKVTLGDVQLVILVMERETDRVAEVAEVAQSQMLPRMEHILQIMQNRDWDES